MRIFVPGDGKVVQIVDLSQTCGEFGVLISAHEGGAGFDSVWIDSDQELLRNSAVSAAATYNTIQRLMNGTMLRSGAIGQAIGTGVIVIPSFADVLFARRLGLTPGERIDIEVLTYRNRIT